MPLITDLRREHEMSVSRTIREDFLEDEDLMTELRNRVGQEHCFATAYGDEFSVDQWVTATLGHLADAIQERIRGG